MPKIKLFGRNKAAKPEKQSADQADNAVENAVENIAENSAENQAEVNTTAQSEIKDELAPEDAEKAASPEKAASAKETASKKATKKPKTVKEKYEVKASALFWDEVKGKALKNNTVFIRILAICTVLGATTALKNGLLLSAVALVVTIPLYLIMALLLKKVPTAFYFLIALLIAGAIETPVIMLATRYFPEVSGACSYFLPITAVNAVLMLDIHVTRGKRSAIRSFGAGVGDVLGYSVVLIVISSFRELIGSGSIYGRMMPAYAQLKFNFALLPPGAFLLLGFVIAIVQGAKIHAEKHHDGEAK